MAPDALPPYVRGQARVLGALFGRSAKCVVVDLDNTLWGGVVGDDGVDGIAIGQGDPVGEAFLAFQQYLLGLKQRGILLTVSSKNELANALAPFELRPEMALRRTDFVAFRANWDPKPDNIRAIAQELNIGLDSLVFVDDNPREREHVRQQLPTVRVVELGDDAADYPRLLDGTGWLEAVRLTEEDLGRTEQYQSNELREELRKSAAGYEGYLASLDQIAVVAPYESRHLDRIAQLINKTNQFNLTTRRQTRSEVESEMNDSGRVTAYVRVADRFGDNGLISVFSARRNGDGLDIEQWLMSCRVLNRGVERLLFNWVAGHARNLGIRTIRGTYLPTAKNGLVRELLPSLGFTPVEGATPSDGITQWVCSLEQFEPQPVQIRLVDDY
jgi:FkbH-like protein